MLLKREFNRLRRLSFLERLSGERTSREILYAHMLSEAMKIEGVSCGPLFPIGGAANYSLLYLIYRIERELNPIGTLELGIGQSTLLLDSLRADGISIEHDPHWADHMRGLVKREIVTAPLQSRTYRGVTADSYSFEPSRKFEFAIVDGPQGAPRNSRWGALEILDKCLEEEFVVIFDDAERIGEQDSALEFQKMRGGEAKVVRSSSSQCIIFSEKFSAVSWY